MKLNRLVCLLTVAFASVTLPASAQSAFKVGMIDMKQVFDEYYKTKQAEAKIAESRNQAKKELDDRLDTFNKTQAEARRLNEEANKPDLSEKAKAESVKALNDKLQELGGLQREIQEFQQSREKQLNEQSLRSRNALVDDINKVIDAKVKAGNYDLVLDKSGQTSNNLSVVIFSKAGTELTEEVIKELNKDKK